VSGKTVDGGSADYAVSGTELRFSNASLGGINYFTILINLLNIGTAIGGNGCYYKAGSGNNNNTGSSYEPAGTWDFSIAGQDVTVTITGTTWTASISGTAYESGMFVQDGNSVTLYSNSSGWKLIGIATLTSNTAMTLTLNSASGMPGTFHGTKRGSGYQPPVTVTEKTLEITRIDELGWTAGSSIKIAIVTSGTNPVYVIANETGIVAGVDSTSGYNTSSSEPVIFFV
jgi:hypothetical protein